MKESLRELATQNHYAARKIQALARGHQCRLKLWSYGGILTVAAVVKIQRTFRGCIGRRKARSVYINFIKEKREIIRGLCRCWKARRVLRIKRAERLDKNATMLQCAYRSRASRRYMAELRRKVLEKMAVRLQRFVRGFVARQWVRRLWVRAQSLVVALRQKITEDIRVANSLTTRMTLETMSLTGDLSAPTKKISDDPQTRKDKVAGILASLGAPSRSRRMPSYHQAMAGDRRKRKSATTTPSRPPEPTAPATATTPPNQPECSSRNSGSLSVFYPTGEPLEFDRVWGGGVQDDIDKWQQLHQCLCHLIATNRPDFCLDLLVVLLQEHPDFIPAVFCLMSALLYSWSSAGVTAAKLIREDYLEEAVAIAIKLKRLQLQHRAARREVGDSELGREVSISVLDVDLVRNGAALSRETDFAQLVEKCYFWNGFRSNGCNARTLSLMGCWVTVRQFAGFGEGMHGLSVGKGEGVGRARRVLDRARDKSSFRDAEGVLLRSVVLENIFENAHETILKQRVAFRDLGEDLEGIVGVKSRTISVDVECCRCGEMLLVSAEVVVPQRRAENEQLEAAMERVGTANKLKWTHKGDITVRPLLLLPPEAAHVYEVSVAYFIKALGQSEVEIRSRPKWRLISEYVCHGARLASCGSSRRTQTSSRRDAASMLSVAKLVLPFVEYRRQERNAIRIEDHSAKLIQRAFRGFQGRALWKRLHLRILDEKRQRGALNATIERAVKARARRHFQASLIASRVKGWLHRKHLGRMVAAAIVIQCMVRCKLARERVVREIRRRAAGPEVVEMLRRGVKVSGHTVTVVIYRCGGSYKVIGHDLVLGSRYMGFVYEPEMTKLLESHNAQYEGQSRAVLMANRVMPWQHLRAAEVLLSNLSLTAPVTSLARELGTGGPTGRKSELVFVVGRHLRGKGVEAPTRRRILYDQVDFINEYDDLMATAAYNEAKKARKSKPKPVF